MTVLLQVMQKLAFIMFNFPLFSIFPVILNDLIKLEIFSPFQKSTNFKDSDFTVLVADTMSKRSVKV